MYRKQLLTAGIGVLGILFSLVAALSDLPKPAPFFLGIFGAGVFLWAALTLYFGREGQSMGDTGGALSGALFGARITRIDLVSEEGSAIASWELYQKVSAVIGKDCGENQVDIDLGRSEYRSLVDVHHAVLNYAEGNWYVEDLGSKNGVVVQKAADGRKYKLSPDQPCKLQYGDTLLIGMSRLKLH